MLSSTVSSESSLRPEHAADGEYQARLPGPVRPQQGGHLAGRYRDRHVADHGAPAPLDGEAAQVKDRAGLRLRRLAHDTSAVPK